MGKSLITSPRGTYANLAAFESSGALTSTPQRLLKGDGTELPIAFSTSGTVSTYGFSATNQIINFTDTNFGLDGASISCAGADFNNSPTLSDGFLVPAGAGVYLDGTNLNLESTNIIGAATLNDTLTIASGAGIIASSGATLGSSGILSYSGTAGNIQFSHTTLPNNETPVTRQTGDARYSALSHSHSFSSLTSKPTSLSGYGITDGITASTAGSTYVKLTGGNSISGAQSFTGQVDLTGQQATSGTSAMTRDLVLGQVVETYLTSDSSAIQSTTKTTYQSISLGVGRWFVEVNQLIGNADYASEGALAGLSISGGTYTTNNVYMAMEFGAANIRSANMNNTGRAVLCANLPPTQDLSAYGASIAATRQFYITVTSGTTVISASAAVTTADASISGAVPCSGSRITATRRSY